MTAPIYLIIDADGVVRNATVGEPPSLPVGWAAVSSADAPEGAWIGWTRVDGVLVAPPDVDGGEV
jgi:hypothetical protein